MFFFPGVAMIVLNVQYKQEHPYVQPFIVMGKYQPPVGLWLLSHG